MSKMTTDELNTIIDEFRALDSGTTGWLCGNGNVGVHLLEVMDHCEDELADFAVWLAIKVAAAKEEPQP